jgi:NRPS condensation-like uncharacterized protein
VNGYFNKQFLVPHDAIDESQDNHYGHGAIFLQGINTKALVTKCKREKVTVGSAIIAACNIVLAKYAQQKGDTEPLVEVEIDFNVRKRLPEKNLNDDYVGLLIGIAPISTKITLETDWWPLCRHVYAELSNIISERKYALFHIVIDTADNIIFENDEATKVFVEERHERFADMNISNIGVFPFSNQFGEYTLERLYTAGGNHPEGVNYLFLINTVGENMTYTLVYEKKITMHSTANQFLNDVVELLNKCT